MDLPPPPPVTNIGRQVAASNLTLYLILWTEDGTPDLSHVFTSMWQAVDYITNDKEKCIKICEYAPNGAIVHCPHYIYYDRKDNIVVKSTLPGGGTP